MMRGPPPFGTYRPGWQTRLILALSQNTPLGRGKSRKLMAGLVRRLNAGRLDTVLFGQNVRLHMHNNSSEIKALMKPSQYSRYEFAFAARHLPAQGGVFIDIGANAGLFSLGILGFMSGGTLIAVEPQPRLFERLKFNLYDLNADKPGRPDIKLFRTAIGPISGDISLSVPDQLGQASAHRLLGSEQITVVACPLIDLLDQCAVTAISLIKVDVEGFEDQVLLPFFEKAPNSLWPQAIVLEHCHHDRWHRDCASFLTELGYSLEGKDRTNLMFLRRAH